MGSDSLPCGGYRGLFCKTVARCAQACEGGVMTETTVKRRYLLSGATVVLAVALGAGTTYSGKSPMLHLGAGMHGHGANGNGNRAPG